MKRSVPRGKRPLALVLVATDRPASYSLDVTARLAGLHPELLRHYCRLGLFGPARMERAADLWFDDDDLFELRRLQNYRQHHTLDRRTVRLLFSLWREVDRLQTELRLLRQP